jgi:hypothetical protein
VVDDQLAPALEELGQRLLALRTVEHVLLLDPLPGPLDPLVMPHNLMLGQESSSEPRFY